MHRVGPLGIQYWYSQFTVWAHLEPNIGIFNAQGGPTLHPILVFPMKQGGPTWHPILVFPMHSVGPPGTQYWYSECTWWAHLASNIGIPNSQGGPTWHPMLAFPIHRVGPHGIQYWYSKRTGWAHLASN